MSSNFWYLVFYFFLFFPQMEDLRAEVVLWFSHSSFKKLKMTENQLDIINIQIIAIL